VNRIITRSVSDHNEVMTRHRFLTALATLCLAASLGIAQNTKKKTFEFRGKVEAINESTKSLTVANENVEGWMSAMTMAYAVDDPTVLKNVKAGDQIKATVYENDFTLYKVEVVTPKK
jgi:Cu/Ag efflux protein CusF